MTELKHVVILGAGVAGLSCAWKLSEAGVNVTVVEKDVQVGGLAKSFSYDDFIVDTGPHRFFSKNQAVIDEVKQLMGNVLREHTRKSRIVVRGRYLDYPVTGRSILQMDKPTVVWALVSYLWQWLKNRVRPYPDDSFENWVTNRFGKVLYDIFFGEYTEKLWGLPPSEISADWAAQRISIVNLSEVVKRLFIRTVEEPRTYARVFYYPAHGIGSIGEAMKKAIIGNGGIILLECAVERLRLENEQVVGVEYCTKSGKGYMEADFYVSTIPVNRLVLMCEPQPPQEVVEAASGLRYRALVFCYLLLDKPQVSDDHWLYFPEKKYIFNRTSEAKVFSGDMAPVDKTSLCAEITCDVDDGVWEMSKEELVDEVVAGLEAVGLIWRKEVMDCFLHREVFAYPVYDQGYNERLGKVLDFVERIENLITIGRQGLFRYNNMDHSIAMGFAVAQHLVEGKSAGEWNAIAREEEYFG